MTKTYLNTMRVLATALDLILLYAVMATGIYMGAFIAGFFVASAHGNPEALQKTAQYGALLGLFFWAPVGVFLNYGILQGLSGKTFGKTVCKIQVTTKEGKVPGVVRSLSRTALYPISLLPLGAGFLSAVFHSRSVTLHDWLSGTYVTIAVDKKQKAPQVKTTFDQAA